MGDLMNLHEYQKSQDPTKIQDLKDGQIWESENYIIKVEKMGIDFQAIFFKNEVDLKFTTIEVRGKKITKLLKNLSAKLTTKSLTLKEQ